MPSYVIYHFDQGQDQGRARRDFSAGMALIPAQDRLDLDGLWIVQADGTSDQIRDELRAHLGPHCALLVLEIGPDAAWTGVCPDVGEWLLEQLSRWRPWTTDARADGRIASDSV